MAHSDPAAGAAMSQPSNPDTQTLITLLTNLIPLLQRIQSGPFEQAAALNPGGLAPGGPAPASPWTGALINNPAVDQQAAVNLVEDITAESLRTLSLYLETYVGRHPGLEHCVPIVTEAANRFAVRDFAECFGLIWQTYRLITSLRAGNLQLPPPRQSMAAAASMTPPTTMVH